MSRMSAPRRASRASEPVRIEASARLESGDTFDPKGLDVARSATVVLVVEHKPEARQQLGAGRDPQAPPDARDVVLGGAR